jgi:hypothetical protein
MRRHDRYRAEDAVMTFGLLLLCGGFLLAVLWFDLMFDVQVVGHRGAEIPEAVLASIAAYYRRVTTDAAPMGHAVGGVMVLGVIVLVVRLATGSQARATNLLSLLLVAAPSALALFRVVPNAIRLGARRDSAAVQSALARSILRDHLVCLAGLIAFVVVQLVSA